MIRLHDRTLFIIIGNFKAEFWIQSLLNFNYLRMYLMPTLEMILQDGVYGIILNTNFLIFNAGISLQIMTEEQLKLTMEELGDQDGSN